MKICKITKLKNSLKIKFDNKEEISLSFNVYSSYNLYINKIIEEKEFKNIKEENEIDSLFSYALTRLARHEYSSKKLEEILYEKTKNQKHIKKTIEKLRELGFLDESNLVNVIIDRCDRKHYGYNRIIKSLKEKGVSVKEISKVKYDLSREEKEARIQVDILKNRYKNKNNFELKKAVFSGLIRYGFDESISNDLVSKFVFTNHNHELNVLKLDYQKYFSRLSRKYKSNELDEKLISLLLAKGYKYNDIISVKENTK